MQATLLCISDSDKHFAPAIQEYEKRLGKARTCIDYKPTKHGEQQTIIQAETELLSEKIAQHSDSSTQLYLLSKAGKSLSTEQLAERRVPGSQILFVIGGPYGLDEEALIQAHPSMQPISLGQQTMPHGLAKLVLLEQYYRVSTLHTGKSYHY